MGVDKIPGTPEPYSTYDFSGTMRDRYVTKAFFDKANQSIINFVNEQRKTQMDSSDNIVPITNGQYRFTCAIQLDDVSITEVNMLRKMLLSNLAYLRRKHTDFHPETDTPNTRRIAMLQTMLDQTWAQLCEAREDRKAMNAKAVGDLDV